MPMTILPLCTRPTRPAYAPRSVFHRSCLSLMQPSDPLEADPRRLVREGDDHIADRYASWVLSGPTDAILTEHLAPLAERLPASAHVLDLGCGSGHRVMDPG